jgi:phosphatidylglycerophosphate synthase
MSFSSLGILNPWIVALLLSREFLLTALRSSISIRKQTLKTSVLGKLKTVIQMGGAGTIFFTLMLKPFHVGVLSSLLSIPFLIAAFVYYLLNKKQPIWGVPVFMSLFIVGMCGFFTSKDFNLFLQLVLIISITWISAIDYIICSLKIFTKTGINEGDIIRLCWCVTQGILVAPIIYRYPYFIFPVLLTISLEFSLGGIDNVVAAEKRKFDYTPFLLSNLYGFLFVFSVKILPFYNIYISHLYLAIFLCFSSLLICSYYFAKNFDLFKRVI